jgi:SAM-dependent methyltransferase
LLGVDWREAWLEHNKARKAPDGPEYWSGRAKDFARYAGTSAYADILIDYLELQPNQSILDMGSGSGTLAIPLAKAGHQVLAADFAPGMLESLECAAQQEGLEEIGTVLLDFNAPWEEWEAVGVTEGCVDVALASRSAMVDDLGEAFCKLERAARTKVAMTIATEFGPRGTKLMEADDKGELLAVPDFIFAVNLLFQMGRYPELRFIDAHKVSEQGPPQFIRWAFISWAALHPSNPASARLAFDSQEMGG